VKLKIVINLYFGLTRKNYIYENVLLMMVPVLKMAQAQHVLALVLKTVQVQTWVLALPKELFSYLLYEKEL
jgi:hypothetical protein